MFQSDLGIYKLSAHICRFRTHDFLCPLPMPVCDLIIMRHAVVHFLQFFFSQTCYNLWYPLERTVTFILRRYSFKYLHIHSLKYIIQNILRSHALIKHLCNRMNFAKSCLQLVNNLIICVRHNLNYKTSCLTHMIILIHKNSKTHRRRNLLRCCKIICQVFCYLTWYKMCLSIVRLSKTYIFYNI